MKKIFTAIILFALALTASAQTFSADQLEKYAKDKYGDNWIKAADNLHQEVALDNKNRLNYQEVIDCAGQTKDQIYDKAMAWFNKAFKSKDTHGVMQEENKEEGLIVARAYIEKVAIQNAGMNHYQVDIAPYIRVDVKEEKARISVYMGSYLVTVTAGGGWTSAIASTLASVATGEEAEESSEQTKGTDEEWDINMCYPYVQKDKHKKASSKAFVMASAFQNSIIDVMKEALLADSSEGFDDNW